MRLYKDGACIDVDVRVLEAHLALGWRLDAGAGADARQMRAELERKNEALQGRIDELEALLAAQTPAANMKVEDIKARLAELGADVPSNAKKAELQALLAQAERQRAGAA